MSISNFTRAIPPLYIATRNPYKVEEFHFLLQALGAAVQMAPAHVVFPAEDGATFEANAQIKAFACFDQTCHASLGDDSGLVVPFLDNRPGVHSARYAGPDATDGENVQKLLSELDGCVPGMRQAYFQTTLVYMSEYGSQIRVHGRVHGSIAMAPRGDQGFGYDSVFIPSECNPFVLTYGEMEMAAKAVTSHRARAARRLKAALHG